MIIIGISYKERFHISTFSLRCTKMTTKNSNSDGNNDEIEKSFQPPPTHPHPTPTPHPTPQHTHTSTTCTENKHSLIYFQPLLLQLDMASCMFFQAVQRLPHTYLQTLVSASIPTTRTLLTAYLTRTLSQCQDPCDNSLSATNHTVSSSTVKGLIPLLNNPFSKPCSCRYSWPN